MGTLGFAVAILMFCLLGAISWSLDFADPVEAILTGQVPPTSEAFSHYTNILPAYYAIDSALIIGWLVGWIGVAVLVRERNRWLGGIVLVLGLAGPLLDFLENEISWALIGVSQRSIPVPVGWLIGWQVVRQLSYLLPFSVAVLAGAGLWGQKTLARVTAGIGTVGVAVALAGLYIPDLWMATQLWWPIWFAALGLLLWQRRMDFSQQETESH